MQLLHLVSQPSRNGEHSKYKNDLITEAKDLEQETIAILSDMLKNKCDISIMTTDGGEVKHMKVSEILQTLESQKKLTSKQPTQPKINKPNLKVVKKDS